ncbi:MAG TPA: sirohydrochlorin chelatase [Candidatus Angelobacter sp.]|nr:sirohydrochlorin chelatase [Candidatus Angelobacter sp.]
MRAVLYVSHGSRVKEGVDQARFFIESCMEPLSVAIQEICFLELVKPSIKEGVERCIQQGADEIIIQPVLLFAAGHVKKDIPEEVNKIKRLYPTIKFSYGKPFGQDARIIDILSERLHQSGTPLLGEAMILLVGRGSSDPEIKENFEVISEAIWNKEGLPIQSCFLAACDPRLSDGLVLAQKSGFRQVFVIPYLMFTGILMKDMKKAIRPYQSVNQTFFLCQSLGYHEKLKEVLIERVNGSLTAIKEVSL